MMYEEYKRQEDKEKNWEKIYSEDQNYITELNNKIFDLEEKNKELEDKIKEIIDKIDVEDYYCLNEAEEDLRKLVE